MQYKIPIQIENEDTIIFGLSLRQIAIIIIGVIFSFGLFNKLQGQVDNVILFIICIVIIGSCFIVAKFRTHEMTFLPFLLNMARYRNNGNGRNGEGRVWTRGVDSYSPLEIGYVQSDMYHEHQKKHQKDTAQLAEDRKSVV